MATVPTQIRIDETVKAQATSLFNDLGMDMSSAVNIFLRQCLLRGGLPFTVEVPNYSQKTLEALAEAKRISRDKTIASYDNLADLKKALDA
ncbi:TPA: type II toxin-antitoxin system RelB/DinJ family antitoxin [Streptococcus agalactiae]|uniref:Type II toxin-antitoxin system RelB/DinJ family antitoxin n=1 Tax=Streptococcus agalactiae TaxID=1311 RepID=A0A7Z6WI90_STRAG|nr:MULTISPECIES: type II toxin-antitoxin system RelB/DinJ family antitoxin [Streptococcus]AXO11667.1 type II toxin-antitoxin system RelB/DinJ family antitoxin [Streptococcus agalactiae]AYZ04844.1 type II toxin-antitoxin system RelB/DinJ family antitoxin [Streptococcus sp. FDAARGOS_520]EMA8750810.1 type II toxin-antitoxin system RelB/DinJ family antitoxin [Streptococcus agalactiae]EMA8752768.1 type II toxin-antitoxin system RelB/DinJ family antitoxin [Streptococcus agalactiae]EPT94048.1 ACP pho